ncbi:MAG: amidohydrolase [Acidimicrobiia bacterium]|nr:amidohydrolase [Acidimicrobiia bacterium]
MIIDFHGHVGSFDSIGARQDADRILRAMDMAQVDLACVFNIGHGDASKANQLTAEFVAQHPDRFIGFLFVTPHYPEEMEAEMIRGADELGLKGIKIYPPYFNRSVEDAIWDPIFSFAHQRKLPVISHTDGTDPIVNPNNGEPQMFVPWAKKYPGANIVLAHAGNFRTGRQSCVRAARSCPNIYIEICTSWRHFRSIEDLVEGAGEDRVLYGSDLPLIDPRIHTGRVLTANISDDAKRKILGDNAARLLHLS